MKNGISLVFAFVHYSCSCCNCPARDKILVEKEYKEEYSFGGKIALNFCNFRDKTEKKQSKSEKNNKN